MTESETRSSRSGSKVEDIATFREFREYSQGHLDVDHNDVHPVAGLIKDDRVRNVLMFMADEYSPRSDEMPRSFWETQFARQAIQKHATQTATRAIAEGNIHQTAYMSGLPSYESDVSGLHAINQLVDWLIHSEQCKLVYLAALMGRGKTDLSLTMMEVIDDHYRRIARSVDEEIEMPEFAANLHVEPNNDTEVKLIDNFDDLLDWADEGDSDMVRWFIFDEASSELTAQSGANSQKVAETMAPFVKKMRKKGINMIVIGHDKGDVHPAVRSMADYVDKTGLKTASFYAGIKKREPVGHLFDLSGIPQTGWEYDTDDLAEWDWCLDDESESIESGMSDEEFRDHRDKRIAALYHQTDVTYADLEKSFEVGSGTVKSALDKFGDRYDTSVDPAEQAIAD